MGKSNRFELYVYMDKGVKTKMNKYSTWNEVPIELIQAKNPVNSIYRVVTNEMYIVQFSKVKVSGYEKEFDHLWIRTKHPEGRDIPWSEKQRIKEEFFPGRWASEQFPPKSDLINDANMYHLYVSPDNVSPRFGLHIFETEMSRDLVLESIGK